MVFNLLPLHRAYQLNPEKSVTLQAANVLIFSKIWQMIDNPDFIPLQDPKLVVVDEVWMYMALPSARPLNAHEHKLNPQRCPSLSLYTFQHSLTSSKSTSAFRRDRHVKP
jgi:hypothetical protein